MADKTAEQYKTPLEKALEALKRWDGANDSDRYADKFVWEAYDTIQAVLSRTSAAGSPSTAA